MTTESIVVVHQSLEFTTMVAQASRWKHLTKSLDQVLECLLIIETMNHTTLYLICIRKAESASLLLVTFVIPSLLSPYTKQRFYFFLPAFAFKNPFLMPSPLKAFFESC